IDDTGGLLEDRLDLRGELLSPERIRPIDLRDEGLLDRRTRWQFRHLDGRAKLLRERSQPLADAPGHFVALRRTFTLGHEVHLQIREAGSAPEKVVTDEAVEVVGRRDAYVLLDIDDRVIFEDR